MADSNTTTFDLPNFVGELYQKGQRPNSFLQLIGGVQGPRVEYASTEFPVGQDYTVPAHNEDRSRVEGANAPDHAGVTRAQVTNVTQIVQESVTVTYTKQGAHQQLGGLNIGGERNPVTDELDFQTGVKMELIARNLNWAFINNQFRKPSTNAQSRRTRGLLQAITSNVEAAGDELLNFTLLDEVMESMVGNGGIADGDNVVTLANTTQLRILNAIFRKYKIKVDGERTIGGVRVRTVYTTFGVLHFALERDLPQDTLVLVNFDVIRVAATPIPGKGVLFREELAKTGANERYQIYGEVGLDHGPEWMHGKITGLSTDIPSDVEDDGGVEG